MPQFRVTAATKWGLLTIQPTAVPIGTTEYLHDVTITNLTLGDPQPVRHKLDSQSTVGLWLNYIERATISHCLVESMGSSAVVFTSCEQALVTDLYTERTCAVLGTNGAVSVEGMGIIVSGCHIHTSGNCAIREKSGNGNLFIGNVVGSAVATVGSQTIALYNVDMRKVQT